MCLYRYHYFAGCQHQSTALFEYCDKATPLHPPAPDPLPNVPAAASPPPSPAPEADSEPNKEGTSGGSRGKTEQEQQAQEQSEQSKKSEQDEQQQRAPAGPLPYSGSFTIDSFPALPTATPPSSHHPTSKVNTKAALSTPVSYAAAVSLPRKQPLRRHPVQQPEQKAEQTPVPEAPPAEAQAPEEPEEPPTAMATLAQFARPSFRSLFGSGTAKPTQAVSPVHHDSRENVDVNDQARSLRSKQTGIREGTEDSSILPDSSEIIRHIAGASRGNSDAQHMSTDSHADFHTNSSLFPGSVHDNSGKSRESYDAIESDLDALKEDISRMKAHDSHAQRSGPGNESTSKATARSPPTRIPQPAQSKQPETAAARLQKVHIEDDLRKAREEKARVPVAQQQPPPPGPHDFPALLSKTTPSRRDVPATSSVRRTSYAQIVSPTPTTLSARVKAAPVFTSPDSDPRASQQIDLGDDSVIASPIGSKVVAPDTTYPATPTKQAPRFAQPTKAFTLRQGETHRKDSVSAGSKNSPNASPNKSVRTLVQPQPKRSSLPGAWMQPSPPVGFEIPGASNPPTANATPPRPGSARPTVTDVKATLRADGVVAGEHTIRKKPSSYMSPTKATVQRELATLGQETVKHVSPRLQKQMPQINTAISSAKVPAPFHTIQEPLSSRTMSSHSEYIITDGPETESPSAAVSAFLDRTTRMLSQTQGERIPSFSSNPSSRPSSRRSTIGTPTVAEILSAVAKETMDLPNTHLRRRGSHGHLLIPIKAKLSKLGLLDEGKHETVVEEDSEPEASPVTTALDHVRAALPETPHRQAPVTSGDYKTVPPHLRGQYNLSLGDFSRPILSSGVPAASQTSSAGVANMLGGQPGVKSTPRSLRATAQEFRPLIQPSPARQQGAPTSQPEGILGYYSDSEWSYLSPGARKAITVCRGMQGQQRATVSFGSPTQFPYHPANPGHWRGFNPGQNAPPTGKTRIRRGSYAGPQIDNLLRSEVDPQTQQLRYTMQDKPGNIVPINFGRAALPAQGSPGTPALSPTSDDTSPRRSPPSPPRGWAIASTAPARSRFAWAGGDGREIKFRGHGPDAERDPNNPINFSLQNRAPSYGGGGPRMIGADVEDDNLSPPLAPRSRRQWAQMLGHSKVPCSNIEITHAFENLAAREAPISSFCYDCRS